MISTLRRIVRPPKPLSAAQRFRVNWYKEEPHVQIPDGRRKELKSKGYLASADVAFDFDRYDKELYVNTRDYRALHPISKSTSTLIDNKAFLPCLFSKIDPFVPEVSIYVDAGQIVYSIGSQSSKTDLRELLGSLLDSGCELFAKKVGSSGGKDAFVVETANLDESIELFDSGKWFINNRLRNAAYSSAIYAQSINTIRVVFFKDSQGEMRLFRVFHRFGTDESGSVDNCGKGGIACSVDVETGEMSGGLIYGSQFRNGRYDNHVDTNARLKGYMIPEWDSKLKDIQNLLDRLFYLTFGGIDLAVTDSGMKILEINSSPDMLLTQMTEPALIDEEFARFLRNAGYKRTQA